MDAAWSISTLQAVPHPSWAFKESALRLDDKPFFHFGASDALAGFRVSGLGFRV